MFKKTQQLQVTEKEKKSQLWVESKKGAYIISWLLLSEVEQDDEYKVMKSLNSNEEYEVISSSINSELSENQKTSLSVTINKFYLKIWSMKKKYLSELWNAAYKNILETL